MIKKFKNKEFDIYGYKLNSAEFRDSFLPGGPKSTDVFLYFDKQDNYEHRVHFVTNRMGLIAKLSFASKLKNQDLYTCIKECVKHVNKNGTYLNAGYISITNSIPLELIDSAKFDHLVSYFPDRCKNMVKTLKQKYKRIETNTIEN